MDNIKFVPIETALLYRAIEYLNSKYDGICIQSLLKMYNHKIEYKPTSHSWYVHGKKIVISTKQRDWLTYRKKSMGIIANCVKVPYTVRLLLSLIHELTHFIQWVNNRKMSEVETSWNELEFMYKNYHEYFKKCTVVFDGRRKINKNFECKL